MQELLEKVLTDPTARDASALPMAATALAEQFAPWSSLE